jgi:hypothetical protein
MAWVLDLSSGKDEIEMTIHIRIYLYFETFQDVLNSKDLLGILNDSRN